MIVCTATLLQVVAFALQSVTAAAASPQVLPFTPKGRQSFLQPLNALRAKPPTPASPKLTPVGYNLDFEAGLVQLVNDLTGKVFWQHVNNIWAVSPKGALLNKFRGQAWNLYLRDDIGTKPGGLGVGWNFHYRMRQAPCFDYAHCSATHYSKFASCASTLAIDHPNKCPHWALYYPRYLLASPRFDIACVITYFVADPHITSPGHATYILCADRRCGLTRLHAKKGLRAFQT